MSHSKPTWLPVKTGWNASRRAVLVVGICGRIGSGKTEVARVFEQGGAVVISADEIGKQVVENDPKVLAELVREFGRGILDPEGRLIRKELARLAFDTPQAKARLDAIVHPHLVEELREQIERHRIEARHMIVVDAALVLNWNLENELDILICVTSSESAQVERLLAEGYSADEARSRLSSQIAEAQQVEKADFVINNSGSIEDLRKRSTWLFRQLESLEKID
jgi:dephospho-CoA kinase